MTKSLLLVPTRLDSVCLCLSDVLSIFAFAFGSLKYSCVGVASVLITLDLGVLIKILELSELSMSLFLYRFFCASVDELERINLKRFIQCFRNE